MEKHFELTDTEFEAQFESCELSPADFSHEAHLRLAWIHINRYGIEKAEENIETQLQNYVVAAGAEDKYHTTLTLSAIKTVYHFMLQSDADNFQDFISAFPRLKHNFKELIAAHYSSDIFNSTKAKAEFLEPDLLPYD